MKNGRLIERNGFSSCLSAGGKFVKNLKYWHRGAGSWYNIIYD
jgi:hypothetical protein